MKQKEFCDDVTKRNKYITVTAMNVLRRSKTFNCTLIHSTLLRLDAFFYFSWKFSHAPPLNTIK